MPGLTALHTTQWVKQDQAPRGMYAWFNSLTHHPTGQTRLSPRGMYAWFKSLTHHPTGQTGLSPQGMYEAAHQLHITQSEAGAHL